VHRAVKQIAEEEAAKGEGIDGAGMAGDAGVDGI
jgi:hypothetical protein